MPVGGPTAQQSVQPIGQMTPADIAALVDELIPAVAKFRSSSTIEKSILNPITWANAGDSPITQISSVGLGLRVICHHQIKISLINAATAAQTVTPSPDFPFNLIQNTQVQINGGATVYSASGIGGLYVWGRRFRGFFKPVNSGGVGFQLSTAVVQTTVGAGGTITNADAGGTPIQLSGIKSISVAGSSTSVITADFVTEHWFVLDMESMLGALPLQNNSTYATIRHTLASSFVNTDSDDTTFPFYNVGANITATVAGTTTMEYHYASVPSDASLYAAIVSNSYQVQEQPGVLGTNGVGGQVYNIPQNQYLVALHRQLMDTNGVPLFFSGGVLGTATAEAGTSLAAANSSNKRVIQYNGGAIIPVVTTDPMSLRADQYRAYGADLSLLSGYLLWDGEDTSNDLQAATDNMGWIDCYNVASPQHVEDIGASVTGPTVGRYIRESIISGSVSVVGG